VLRRRVCPGCRVVRRVCAQSLDTHASARRAAPRSRRARPPLSGHAADAPPGMVSLVGAGPGDPGLLTVRGRDLLARCDAVVFDALANRALLEIATQGGRDVELYDVGKRGGKDDSAKQSDIDALLVRL